MADIPPASAPPPLSSSSPSAPAAPAGNVAAVGAVVNSAPDKIQNLSRQIQISGLIAAPPDGNTVTLNTAIGPLTIVLPQMAAAQRTRLIQQLITLFQNQKPLTVVIEPGNPPAQAFLLLPSTVSPGPNAPANVLANALPNIAPQPNAPVLNASSIGTALLVAVVLPQDISLPLLAPQAGSYALPAANPNAGANINLAGTDSAPPAEMSPALGAAAAFMPNEIMANEFMPVEQALAKLEGQALPNILNPASAFALPVPEDLPPLPPPLSSPLPFAPAAFGAPPSAAAPLSWPGGSASPVPLLQPGAQLTLRVSAVILPDQAAPSAPLAPGQFLATVAGNGTNGQLILKAGDAMLYVRQSASLPAGTQLIVTAAPAQPSMPSLLTLPDQPAWTMLQQVMAALMQINPSMAQAIIANRMPQPGAAMPGGLLFVLSALRQGNLRLWLGDDAVDTLVRAGKGDLIAKLAQDLRPSPGSGVHDSVVGQWRSYSVPVYDNPYFRLIQFYVHGDYDRRRAHEEAKDPAAEAARIRFLIDVRMSRLGAMQLDGFLRKNQLDMIVRSEEALPPGLDRELKQAYLRVLGAVDYAGTIAFQQGRQHWINIQRSAAGKAVVT